MKEVPKTGRWAIAIFDRAGYFWDYVKDIKASDPYNTPLVLANRPSAVAYAAWKLDWAKARNYHDTYGMRVLNLDDTDAVRRPDLAWPGALVGAMK